MRTKESTEADARTASMADRRHKWFALERNGKYHFTRLRWQVDDFLTSGGRILSAWENGKPVPDPRAETQ